MSWLTRAQKLPCTFNLDVPGLGHLEGTGERDVRRRAVRCALSWQIRRGTTIELPFWLGLDLASVHDRQARSVAPPDARSDLLSLALPKPYASRVRNALSASAQSVSLKALNGGAFFPAGVRLNATCVLLNGDADARRIQDDKLKEVMHTAFKEPSLAASSIPHQCVCDSTYEPL